MQTQPAIAEKIVAKMMSEAQTITNKRVIEFRVTLEKRFAGATHRRHLCHGQLQASTMENSSGQILLLQAA